MPNAIRTAGIMAAATIGAGIFSLPYVFRGAGWAAGFLLLGVSTAVFVFVHNLYWRVLEHEGNQRGLLGLAARRFGSRIQPLALIVVHGGLLFTLVAYLILGKDFIVQLFPVLTAETALLVFWALCAAPFFLSEKSVARSEFLGAVLMAVIIIAVLINGAALRMPFSVSAFRPAGILVAIAAIHFALAGWTGAGSVFRRHRASRANGSLLRRAMAWGTVSAAVLYGAFVLGVWLLGGGSAPDALSFLPGAPSWLMSALFVMGLFAIWTSYVPIGSEMIVSFNKDLRVPKNAACALVAIVPLLLVFSGMDNFIAVVELVGGVFLAGQYLLIVFVARGALKLSSSSRVVSAWCAALFACIAAAELLQLVF